MSTAYALPKFGWIYALAAFLVAGKLSVTFCPSNSERHKPLRFDCRGGYQEIMKLWPVTQDGKVPTSCCGM